MRTLPDWIQNGAVVGLQGGTERVKELVARLKKANVPIADPQTHKPTNPQTPNPLLAVWLQDWTGKIDTGFGQRLLWNWELNKTWYPGWDEMVSDFALDNINVMTYINPHLFENHSLFYKAKELDCLVLQTDNDEDQKRE
eukprot:Pgem_evm1s14255